MQEETWKKYMIKFIMYPSMFHVRCIVDTSYIQHYILPLSQFLETWHLSVSYNNSHYYFHNLVLHFIGIFSFMNFFPLFYKIFCYNVSIFYFFFQFKCFNLFWIVFFTIFLLPLTFSPTLNSTLISFTFKRKGDQNTFYHF